MNPEVMFELRFELQPGTARYEKVQNEIQKYLTKAATLQSLQVESLHVASHIVP
ncbi:MAG: hypothetical protein AAB354_03005 [candidate division KSB1 bacterium]